MRIKILHQRRRQQRQQQQPGQAVPAAPPSPPSPQLPSAASTSSDDGESLKRRTSTFGSLERQFSGLSLRTSFGRMRRARSPPPPYTPIAPPNAAVVEQAPREEEAVAAITAVATVVDTSAATPKATTVEDAITAIKETSDIKSDTKMVATVDITPAPAVAVADKMLGSPSKAEQAAEELLLDVAAAPLEDVSLPSPGEAAAFRRLGQPVVVPRLHGGATVPFARGYAPCLGDTHGIDAATFLAFIDGLNLVMSPHPAALALSAVSFSMNFVPHDYADAVGAVTQLLADVTTRIVAHQRGKAFLARANATLFHPRGLHVAIANTKRMRAVLGIAPKASLLAPLSEETLELATLERCMHHLNASGWAALLELEVRTGCLMPMAKPSYRQADASAGWHPDYAAASEPPNPSNPPDIPDRPLPLRRSSSTWTQVGRSVSHGLAIVADKRVRSEIRKAERAASRARRRAWRRHSKGKKLKEPFGEKFRVSQLSWILVRNLDDVEREKAEKEAAQAAKAKV